MNATLRTPLKGLHSAKMFSDSFISSSGVLVLEKSVSCGERRVFCLESFCTEENTNRFVHSLVRIRMSGADFLPPIGQKRMASHCWRGR
ncbi:unnamed protein product [Ixodes pacificus]